MSRFRIATFNVENLFDRPKVFMMKDFADGDQVTRDIANFRNELRRPTYDKQEILKLYRSIKAYVDVIEVRNKLFNRAKTKVLPDRRGDWFGWTRLKRRKFRDKAISNTARVLREVNADVVCAVEVENRIVLERFSRKKMVFTRQGKKQRYPYTMLRRAGVALP